MRDYQKKIGAMTFEEISSFQQRGEVRIEEEVFYLEEIEIFQKPKEGMATISNSFIAIELDCELTPELIRGGYAREVVNRIQRARKEQGFKVSDRVDVIYEAQGELGEAMFEMADYIAGEVLALDFKVGQPSEDFVKSSVDGNELIFSLSLAGR